MSPFHQLSGYSGYGEGGCGHGLKWTAFFNDLSGGWKCFYCFCRLFLSFFCFARRLRFAHRSAAFRLILFVQIIRSLPRLRSFTLAYKSSGPHPSEFISQIMQYRSSCEPCGKIKSRIFRPIQGPTLWGSMNKWWQVTLGISNHVVKQTSQTEAPSQGIGRYLDVKESSGMWMFFITERVSPNVLKSKPAGRILPFRRNERRSHDNLVKKIFYPINPQSVVQTRLVTRGDSSGHHGCHPLMSPLIQSRKSVLQYPSVLFNLF